MTCDRSLENVSIEELLNGVLSEAEVKEAQLTPGGRTVVVYGDYYENPRREVKSVNKETSIRSPWISGGFYLLSAAVLIALLAAVAKAVSFWVLPVVIVGGLILLSVIGALQLRTDEKLSEKGFLHLMRMSFRQIPVLGKLARSARTSAS